MMLGLESNRSIHVDAAHYQILFYMQLNSADNTSGIPSILLLSSVISRKFSAYQFLPVFIRKFFSNYLMHSAR